MRAESKNTMNIFFDFDGTLIDVSQKYYHAHCAACKIMRLRSCSFKKYWGAKRSKTPEHELVNLDLHSTRLRDYENSRIRLLENNEFLEYDKLFPFTKKLLQSLKDRHRLFLVTLRRDAGFLLREVNNFGIANFFTKILIHCPKSNALVAKMNLLKEIKFSSDDLIVGDTEVDIEAGKQLNLITVAVESGIRKKSILKKYAPDYLFKNAFQLFIKFKF